MRSSLISILRRPAVTRRVPGPRDLLVPGLGPVPLLVVLLLLAGCPPPELGPDTPDDVWSTSPAEETRPLFTEDFPPEEFAERRAGIFDAIGDTAFALVQGAPSPRGFVRFRQTNQFHYLSGIETPHAYLLLDGASRRTRVYLPPRDERREFNEGKVLSADDGVLVMELTGVDDVHPLRLLPVHLGEMDRDPGYRSVFTPFAPREGARETRGMVRRALQDRDADPLDDRSSRTERLLERLQEGLEGLTVRDLTPTLDSLRMIKSPRELELIRTSARLHGLAILEAMRSTSPGVTEYEMESVARYVYWRHGVQGSAYYALAHVGPNAYMNHYHAGVRAAEPGDMILLDYGADYRYHVSDMARMWPADGRFNPVQAELYGFYLAFYEAILDAIRPGATPRDVKLEALEEIEAILEEWEFSKPIYREAAREFVDDYREGARRPDTRLGHWVGMAAHDPGPAPDTLRPGMVFVIEPQFRVPEERIYIRLEDTIAITEDGVEIFSDFVPRDMRSIERIVRDVGLLDRFPRLLDEDGEFLETRLLQLAGVEVEGARR